MESNSSLASCHNELQGGTNVVRNMKHLMKVVVGRDIHGTVTVTVTHNKLILQTDDIASGTME